MNHVSFKEVKFKSGDLLFSEKQEPSAIYIIRKGQVEVFRTGNNNTKIPLAVISPGQYLGELSLILEKPHTSAAMAVGDVEAVKIDKTAFDAQLKSMPPFMITLVRSLAERLTATNDIVRRNSIVDTKVSDHFKAAEQKAEADNKALGKKKE